MLCNPDDRRLDDVFIPLWTGPRVGRKAIAMPSVHRVFDGCAILLVCGVLWRMAGCYQCMTAQWCLRRVASTRRIVSTYRVVGLRRDVGMP